MKKGWLLIIFTVLFLSFISTKSNGSVRELTPDHFPKAIELSFELYQEIYPQHFPKIDKVESYILWGHTTIMIDVSSSFVSGSPICISVGCY